MLHSYKSELGWMNRDAVFLLEFPPFHCSEYYSAVYLRLSSDANISFIESREFSLVSVMARLIV